MVPSKFTHRRRPPGTPTAPFVVHAGAGIEDLPRQLMPIKPAGPQPAPDRAVAFDAC